MSLLGRFLRRLAGQPAPPRFVDSRIDFDRELPWLTEQIRANASLVPQRIGGPGVFDNYTNETPEMRAAYRRALAEPSIKAALLGKIAAVMALGLQVKPAQDTPLDQEVADFVRHALTKCVGGLPELIWAILSGGTIDGYSVCEKVWRQEDRGRFKGKKSLLKLKAKDTKFIQFELDAYRNVVGVVSMRGNSGETFPPSDFVLFRYMSLFESPFGMSDLRAAYRAAEMIPQILRLRMIFLDKLSGPFLHAKVNDPALVASMKAELAKARAGGFIVTTPQDDIVALDLAMRGTSEFLSAIDDLRKEVAIGISGAFLHMMTGGGSDQRGNSQVQQDTVDLFIWLLKTLTEACISEQLLRDLIDPNYGTACDLPTVTLEAPNPEAIIAELGIDQALDSLGVPLSLSELYERTGRRPPKDPADTIQKPPDEPPFGAGLPGVDGPGGPGGRPPTPPTPARPLAADDLDDDDEPASFGEGWDESKHPRADDGQFGSGGGGGGGKKSVRSLDFSPVGKTEKDGSIWGQVYATGANRRGFFATKEEAIAALEKVSSGSDVEHVVFQHGGAGWGIAFKQEPLNLDDDEDETADDTPSSKPESKAKAKVKAKVKVKAKETKGLSVNPMDKPVLERTKAEIEKHIREELSPPGKRKDFRATDEDIDRAVQQAIGSHKTSVRMALAMNQPVPDQALIDYPDLAAEYNRKPVGGDKKNTT